uniref:Uncharacterized protein n=2 Tax=Meloidogyne TaxID=189290 RepID=A0A6V7VF20_MELEN|nr:unnamed protein product [Meloidogyne enterolobii]
MSPPMLSSKLIRRLILVTLITLLYICARTYKEYRNIISSRDETTAITIIQPGKEAEFIKLQKIIKDEIRAMQTVERIRSERLISSLIGMLNKQKSLEEEKTTQPDPGSQKAIFRLQMNLSRLFDFF